MVQASYRCEASMIDGKRSVLHITCATPEAALQMARADWRKRKQQPVEIRVYLGKTDGDATPLLMWKP
jgi:hypothetical protein